MKKSFTLIELLIVLVIIGIVAALAIPRASRYILKSKMMKRVPVLDQIRTAELAYKSETGNFWLCGAWLSPNDNTQVNEAQYRQDLKASLGLEIPYISDYKNQESSFVVLQQDDNPGAISAWFSGDPRFVGKYAYISYGSQGVNSDGDACIIMCYDANFNVQKLSIKYKDGTVDDIVRGQ